MIQAIIPRYFSEMSGRHMGQWKAVTYLIERDMPISADPSQKEIDTANSLNGSFVIFTFLVEIFSFTIQNVCVIGAICEVENIARSAFVH